MVENLNLVRKPFPDLEAVYLVDSSSLEKVLKDFDEPITPARQKNEGASDASSSSSSSVNYQPEEYMYRAVHLFFVSGLSQMQIDLMKSHPHFTERCVTIADAAVDFTVEEAYLAHLASPHYIQSLLPGTHSHSTNALFAHYKRQVCISSLFYFFIILVIILLFTIYYLFLLSFFFNFSAHFLPYHYELGSSHSLSGRFPVHGHLRK